MTFKNTKSDAAPVCLDGLLESDVSNFIDKQRQQDGRGEGKDEGQTVEHQRVAQDVGEGGVVEKLSEIFQPDPIGAGDGGEDVVVLEGNDDAIHGDTFPICPTSSPGSSSAASFWRCSCPTGSSA